MMESNPVYYTIPKDNKTVVEKLLIEGDFSNFHRLLAWMIKRGK